MCNITSAERHDTSSSQPGRLAAHGLEASAMRFGMWNARRRVSSVECRIAENRDTRNRRVSE